jgi:hypothetical protein
LLQDLQYTKRFDTRPCSPTRVESCCPPPSSPQEEQSETPLSKSTPTRRVVFATENAAVCAALSAEPVRVSVEWYMYVAHSSPLQIRSHLTCQFFCRQLRSHLDNQVRRYLAVISTATLGHLHNHLRACSQVRSHLHPQSSSRCPARNKIHLVVDMTPSKIIQPYSSPSPLQSFDRCCLACS